MKRVAMPALVLRKSALSLVLATLPFIFLLTLSGQPAGCSSFLTDSLFLSSRQSLVFVSYRPVLMCVFRVSAPA